LARFTGGGQVGAGAPPSTVFWQLVERHEAVGAESTFTFSFTADDMDDTSCYVLILDLTTSGALALQCQTNGHTTAQYFIESLRTGAGATTIIDINSANEAQLVDNTALIGANAIVLGMIVFGLGKGATNNLVSAQWNLTGNGFLITGSFRDNNNSDDLNEILIKTSTSTWKIGTRMTLYKVTKG